MSFMTRDRTTMLDAIELAENICLKYAADHPELVAPGAVPQLRVYMNMVDGRTFYLNIINVDKGEGHAHSDKADR